MDLKLIQLYKKRTHKPSGLKQTIAYLQMDVDQAEKGQNDIAKKLEIELEKEIQKIRQCSLTE